MGIFIKNPAVERKARELASLRGVSLTAAVDQALDAQLEAERDGRRRRPTVAEMQAATDEFRRVTGLDQIKPKPMTKQDWDDLWPIDIPEVGDA